MYHERIMIDADDGGWVRFTRSHGFGGRDSRDSLEIPPGFTLDDILAAIDATGWIVERHGERCIQDQIGCDQLVRTVEQMLSYFDRPDGPNGALLVIKDQIDACFGDAVDDLEIPLWAYAWLDLVLREDLADAARSASMPWKNERLMIDVSKLRDARIRELRHRYSQPRAVPEAQRIAGSARTRDAAIIRTGGAGFGTAG
ncbi:MAG TPA: hypothetical protein VND64_09545 [Pirellulales bacterium]|nr:hypothetical protein [Pirellulales bacterium]